ncbi:MAG: histidinol-phosphate transaminase [Hadesarchaea archaeon]|nr:histidinol-phosphate transaminase [Hadesarchaea archaeon]
MFSNRAKEIMKTGVKYPLAKSSDEIDEEVKPVKLCSNENPLGPSPKAVEALKNEAEKIGEYPDSSALELKKAISNHLSVEPNMICLGNGSDEVMDLACKAFIDPGDKCLIPTPTFSMYEIACQVNLGEPNFVELPEFQWEKDTLLSALKDSTLAFIGRPNNPTGNSMNEGDLKELLETGKPIIVDEAYGEFAEYSVVDWTKSYDNLLVLKTFSKIYGLAGIRVGYSIGNPKIIEVLERIRSPFNVNRLAQVAAIAALEDEEFIQEVKEIIINGRNHLRKELTKLGFRVLPSDANFLMVGLQDFDTNSIKVCNYLAKQGILVRNLANFRGAGLDWIRITVGKPSQNEKLLDALKKFKEG